MASGDKRVRLLGPVCGEGVREPFAHAYLYVQPSEIEGTALSLVEAMGFGNCVLVSNIAENLETVGDAGLSFDIKHPVASLRNRLRELFASPELVACHRQKSLAYGAANYSWDRVTDQHEDFYYQVAGITPR